MTLEVHGVVPLTYMTVPLPLGPLAAQHEADSSAPLHIATLDVPVVADPRRYPLDRYAFESRFLVTYSAGVFVTRTGFPQSAPMTQDVVAQPSLDGFSIRHSSAAGTFDVRLTRSFWDILFIGVLVLVPVVLAGLIWLAINLEGQERAHPLEIVVGVTASLLALLPIRTVLVPPDIPVLTLLDFILGAELGLLAAVVCFHMARQLNTTRPRKRTPSKTTPTTGTSVDESSGTASAPAGPSSLDSSVTRA